MPRRYRPLTAGLRKPVTKADRLPQEEMPLPGTQSRWDNAREWIMAIGSLNASRNANDAANRSAEDQYGLARHGQIADRFSKAVEQIADVSIDVRLGGLYALESVARQSPEDQETVKSVVAAFVRTHSSLSDARCASTPPDRVVDPVFLIRRPAEDMRAAIDLLADPVRTPDIRTGPDARWTIHFQDPKASAPPVDRYVVGRLWQPDTPAHPTDLSSTCLANMQLGGARLQNVVLEGSDVRGALLTQADLRGAKMGISDLGETHIEDADFSYSHMEGADLSGVTPVFDDCPPWAFHNPAAARFSHTDLSGADLGDAKLLGGDFTYAQLQGADLSFTSFERTDLQGATIASAVVRGTVDFEESDLSDSRITDMKFYTVAGPGFTEPLPSDDGEAVLNLRRADLKHADIRGLDLSHANLEGADLSGAQIDAPAKIVGVHYDSETQWPTGYHPPPSRAIPARIEAGEDEMSLWEKASGKCGTH
jgi:uncharacterized protein YjbI with pentapeptide repeats